MVDLPCISPYIGFLKWTRSYCEWPSGGSSLLAIIERESVLELPSGGSPMNKSFHSFLKLEKGGCEWPKSGFYLLAILQRKSAPK